MQLFTDQQAIGLIQRKLPISFQYAEVDCSRAGRVGMEVGSERETILVSLFIHYFGKENVETEIPITDSEVDVRIFDIPLSIKTKTGNSFGGIKAVWTVDPVSAKQFKTSFTPKIDILLAQIIWNQFGSLYYIPVEVQKDIFSKIGIQKFLNLPKEGTNPRGVEFSSFAIQSAVNDKRTHSIKINWQKKQNDYNKYDRWVDFWNEP